MHIVYILLSKKDPARYYIGITQNLNQRILDHNQSRSGYSKRYSPWELETCIAFNNKELAYQFEKYIKNGSGHAFLKKRLISDL